MDMSVTKLTSPSQIPFQRGLGTTGTVAESKSCGNPNWPELRKTKASATEEGRTPVANSETQTAQAKTATKTMIVLTMEPSLAATIVLVEAEPEAVEARKKGLKSSWRFNRWESTDHACRKWWVTQQAHGRWGTAAEEITAGDEAWDVNFVVLVQPSAAGQGKSQRKARDFGVYTCEWQLCN